MKKTLITISILLPLLLGGAPVLFESFQTGNIMVQGGSGCDTAVVKISFSVDEACYALFSTGGQARLANFWLKLDGAKLRPKIACSSSEIVSVPMTYTTYLEPGDHTITFWMECYRGALVAGDPYCANSYLQALLFLPDTAVIEAVEEDPISSGEVGERKLSLISKGPYVQVPGCTDLVDASGRVIENAIQDDQVFISNLTEGTYFARSGEETVVKIVKVK